jgi:Na+/proline symporter
VERAVASVFPSASSMLSPYDYAVLGFYFLLILAVGFVFRAVNKDSSDYFRGSGSLLWWIVGASAFMQQISAFTFTGVAGKAYADGTIVTVVFFANALGYFVNYLWTAQRFRQMRLITPIQAVRERFGPANEQFFTWLQVPVNVLYAGIWLSSLSVFVAAVFDVDFLFALLVTGAVVVVASVVGGSWAAVASDFVQMLVLMLITVVAAAVVFVHPAIGGVTGFIAKAPTRYFNWTELARPEIVYVWVFASFTKQMFGLNNLMDASRYLCARDSRHAKRAALLACGLMLLGPFIWFIPPMAAAILTPSLPDKFPQLQNPGDAAYVFTGLQTLPAGMMGLLLCGMCAATMASMDSALNRNAGILVKNCYQVLIAKEATETHLLRAGRVTSAILGLLVIVAALAMSSLKDVPLFDLMLLYGGLVALPASIPLALGIFLKRTPPWSGWSTVLVGFALSLWLINGVDPQAYGRWLGFNGEMSTREVNDFRFFAGVLGNVVVCTAWFLFSALFYARTAPARQSAIEAFFARMATPVVFETEPGAVNHDRKQFLAMGTICIIYAAFLGVVGTIVPGSGWTGRLSFVAVAGTMAVIGGALWISGKKTRSERSAEAPPPKP